MFACLLTLIHIPVGSARGHEILLARSLSVGFVKRQGIVSEGKGEGKDGPIKRMFL
jgi:hypothetical protein